MMLFNCDVSVLEYALGSKIRRPLYKRRPLEEYWIKQARKKCATEVLRNLRV